MQQLLEQQECYGVLGKIHLLWEIIFHIYYLKKGNVVHFKIIILFYLLTQSLYAKPIIYFVLSNNFLNISELITVEDEPINTPQNSWLNLVSPKFFRSLSAQASSLPGTHFQSAKKLL